MADRHRQWGSQPLRFLILALVLAVIAGVGAVWGKSMLTASGALRDGGASTIPSSLYSPTPEAGGPGGRGIVAAATPAADSSTPADPSAVASRIAGVTAKQPGTLGAATVDLTTGITLFSKNADALMTPASNLKVLTGIGLLNAVDAGKTFATKVVRSSDDPSTITLVGGGDPYLQATPSATNPDFASTQVLAKNTAAALKKDGVTSVTLDYDDSLFGSDSWNSAWPAGYADQVTHISALWVNEGVDASGARSTTPSLQAATTFASQLTASGITVTGTPGAKQAPSSASTVASVNSAPVETLLKTALLHSDNSATEVLGRQSALAAGKPGTFAGATANLQAQLTSLGAWQSGAVLQDTSGLSRGNLVSATMLEKAWRAALTTARLQPIADAVPVAQVSGSLASRFGDDADVAGRGVVHAKTGTLTGVSSLSGWIRTADGRVVVQAFLLNNSADDSASHTWLDAAWSAVASCGC